MLENVVRLFELAFFWQKKKGTCVFLPPDLRLKCCDGATCRSSVGTSKLSKAASALGGPALGKTPGKQKVSIPCGSGAKASSFHVSKLSLSISGYGFVTQSQSGTGKTGLALDSSSPINLKAGVNLWIQIYIGFFWLMLFLKKKKKKGLL